eukprot:1059588-Rhodomonas_salina.1
MQHETSLSLENADSSVSIFPRRKAGAPRRPRHEKIEPVVLTKEILANFFHVPLPEAAEMLVSLFVPHFDFCLHMQLQNE